MEIKYALFVEVDMFFVMFIVLWLSWSLCGHRSQFARIFWLVFLNASIHFRYEYMPSSCSLFTLGHVCVKSADFWFSAEFLPFLTPIGNTSWICGKLYLLWWFSSWKSIHTKWWKNFVVEKCPTFPCCFHGKAVPQTCPYYFSWCYNWPRWRQSVKETNLNVIKFSFAWVCLA